MGALEGCEAACSRHPDRCRRAFAGLHRRRRFRSRERWWATTKRAWDSPVNLLAKAISPGSRRQTRQSGRPGCGGSTV